ncbi:lipid phosphate phosphatase 1 [Amylocystis lapponica]|nr:lipid phosphate phosphatase 1 [Amylocystis lapponica]
MALTALASVRRKLTDTFGDDFLSWFDRSYILDWFVASAAWLVASYIKTLPPFEREFDRHDPLIDHSHKHNQVGSNFNWTISFIIPLAAVVTVGCLRRSAIEIHHGCLALWADRGFNSLITEFLKNRVGRLRPDFLARCKWDKDTKACTGDLDSLLDGRKSFPSGHSSTAFSGMTFLFLFISGMTGAWCLSQPARARSLMASKLARMALSLAPLAYATWVAVTRRHHKEDVIVGSIIGATTATVCYLIYWPNPFAARTSNLTGSTRAKVVYTDTDTSGNEYGYELTGMEHTDGVQPV